jgi:hypothetical protein
MGQSALPSGFYTGPDGRPRMNITGTSDALDLTGLESGQVLTVPQGALDLAPTVANAMRLGLVGPDGQTTGTWSSPIDQSEVVGVPLPPAGVAQPSFGVGSLEDQSFYVSPGVITSSYQRGVAMLTDGNLPWSERIVGGVAATAMAPMMLAEETGRAFMNVPYYGSQIGQNAAELSLATTTEDRVVPALKLVQNASAGFLGASVVLPSELGAAFPDRAAGAAESSWEAALNSYEEGAATSAPMGPRLQLDAPMPHPAGQQYALSPGNALSFVTADPIVLAGGTRIYRVVDDIAPSNGSWWSLTLPESRSVVRGGLAVRSEWNQATQYVEHVLPEGGLPAWVGPASSQTARDGVSSLVLNGGATQLFIPTSRTSIPANLIRRPFP